MTEDLEQLAYTPDPVRAEGLNPAAELPYGLSGSHILLAMAEFVDFLGFLNQQLHTKGIARLESMLMPANFSSMVGEFMISAIPKYYPTLAKNNYHNGHPDLVPAGVFTNNAVQHADAGIEVKASRYAARWQGHNPEDTWLMVFVFDSNRPADIVAGVPPRPFRFKKVVGSRLTKADWKFAGRSETSRRTITASVTTAATARINANWIYRDPDS